MEKLKEKAQQVLLLSSLMGVSPIINPNLQQKQTNQKNLEN
jgi:hypothetical protein